MGRRRRRHKLNAKKNKRKGLGDWRKQSILTVKEREMMIEEGGSEVNLEREMTAPPKLQWNCDVVGSDTGRD